MLVSKCPVCGNDSFQLLHACKDHVVSHETFSVVTCTKCGLGITQPQPEINVIGKYYQSSEYISHTGKQQGLQGILYKTVRKYTLNRKRGLLQSFFKTGKILDYGCGTGEFLAAMKQSGWMTVGIEPSQQARTKAENLLQQRIHADFNTIPDQLYNTITLWHVLEHVHNISETLSKLRSLLHPEGYMLIAVPNHQSLDAEIYQSYWAGYDVPRHLWHFTRENMKTLLHNHQLNLVTTLPMKFDAVYVSLLSEQYRNTSFLKRWLLALHFGLKSNRKAKNTGDYSSLIFVAQPA